MTTLIDESTLTQLLRGVLGQARNLVSYRFLRKATDYAVVAAALTDPAQAVVIKLAGPQAVLAPDFARSATIAQVVRSCSGVQTFEVLAVDTSARRWPWQYLVTTWCPGQLWSAVRPRKKNGEARALYISLGAAIGQMHTIGFSTCGEITSDGRVLAGTSYAAALRRRAQRRIANPAHVALFLSVLQEHHALFESLPAGVLCHEDLNPGNLLVQELPAGPPALWVLDFDSAWAGCAESDLARLEFWRGMMGEGFWEAYRTFAPLSDSYSQRRPIFQLLWCLEYARPTVKHLRDTASVCEALRLPPVTFP